MHYHGFWRSTRAKRWRLQLRPCAMYQKREHGAMEGHPSLRPRSACRISLHSQFLGLRVVIIVYQDRSLFRLRCAVVSSRKKGKGINIGINHSLFATHTAFCFARYRRGNLKACLAFTMTRGGLYWTCRASSFPDKPAQDSNLKPHISVVKLRFLRLCYWQYWTL